MSNRVLLDIEELEKRIGYTFTNKALITRALTHRSFAADHNERLEFLGDSVLDCVIAKELFFRDTHFDEGALSRIRANFVCESSLAEIAFKLEINRFLRMGEGELKSGGAIRPSIMADACEAVFGAVFLDGGYEEATRVILAIFSPIIDGMPSERTSKDKKTMLQEFLQGVHLPIPKYAIERCEGPAHDQTFYCSCTVEKLNMSEGGVGKSRRTAEREAAGKMLERLTELQKTTPKLFR